MKNTSRFLSKFGAVLLCGMMLSSCSANDMEISNSFFPNGVEAHDEQVAQWKFERAERKRLKEEARAREAARREAEKQARIAKKQQEMEARQRAEEQAQAGEAQVQQNNVAVQPVEQSSLSTTSAPPPGQYQQPQYQQPQHQQPGSMIPMDEGADTDMAAPMQGEYSDETMSPMPVTPAAQDSGPVDLTAPQQSEPAQTLENEGSITREEFERLMREKQMQQEYLEMRDEQMTLHPFLIMGESSETSTLIMKPADAPMATKKEDADLPPAVEVFPVWEESRADSPSSIYDQGETATHDSVTVFPLDGPYSGDVPVLVTSPFDDSPGWGGVKTVNANKATSGLNQPGVSYSRAVSVAGNPYLRESIFFNHASKKLSANDRKKLDALVRKIADGKNKLVRVIGHASKRTATKNNTVQDIVNYRVSLARAGAVTKMLLQSGLPAEWLEVTGYGDTLPAADTDEAANRRVDVLVYHAK